MPVPKLCLYNRTCPIAPASPPRPAPPTPRWSTSPKLRWSRSRLPQLNGVTYASQRGLCTRSSPLPGYRVTQRSVLARSLQLPPATPVVMSVSRAHMDALNRAHCTALGGGPPSWFEAVCCMLLLTSASCCARDECAQGACPGHERHANSSATAMHTPPAPPRMCRRPRLTHQSPPTPLRRALLLLPSRFSQHPDIVTGLSYTASFSSPASSTVGVGHVGTRGRYTACGGALCAYPVNPFGTTLPLRLFARTPPATRAAAERAAEDPP